jgi:hypothetical protein
VKKRYAEGQEDEMECLEWPFRWVCVEEEGVFPTSEEGVPEGCDIARSETIRPTGPDHPSETATAHITETIRPVPEPPRPKPPGMNYRGYHRGYRWGRYYKGNRGDTAGAEITRAKTIRETTRGDTASRNPQGPQL